MVSVRDVVRRTQRQVDYSLEVDLPTGVDDVVDDVADEFLSALPEDIRMAIQEAVDQTDNSLQDIIQDAEAAGQPITEYVRDQFDTFLPDEEETPPEEDEEDDKGTSIADLVGEAEPEVFDRTFLVEKEDAPASTGDPWPIPQPWQGLPRLAFVVNLNYVYDEENEEWMRQVPSDAPEREIIASGSIVISSGGFESIVLPVDPQKIGNDTLEPIVTPTATDPAQNVDTAEASLADTRSALTCSIRLSPLQGEYRIIFSNEESVQITANWSVRRNKVE